LFWTLDTWKEGKGEEEEKEVMTNASPRSASLDTWQAEILKSILYE
jgi:hypothetical protein